MVRLQPREHGWVIQLELVVSSAILLPDVGVDTHFSSGLVNRQVEDAGTPLDEFGTKGGKASLAAVG